MPGTPRALISDVLCCADCRKDLAGDECPCGFTCSIEELRRRGYRIPDYYTPAEPPHGVWTRQSGSACLVTAYPLSIQVLVAWMAILVSGLIVIAGGHNLLIVAVTAIFWVNGGFIVLRIVRVHCDAGWWCVATAAWNLLWPHRIDCKQLRAIRLRVRYYSNGETERSLILDANEIVEVGRYMGPDQVEYVMWTLYRRALERR